MLPIDYFVTFFPREVTIGKTFHTASLNGNSFGGDADNWTFLFSNLFNFEPLREYAQKPRQCQRLAFNVHLSIE